MMIAFRPTTADDIHALGARVLPYRVQAVTAIEDGRVLGCGGLEFLPSGSLVAFVQIAPGVDVKRYGKTLHRAAFMVIEGAVNAGYRQILALCDEGKPRAAEWLVRLGFREIESTKPRVFLWHI